MNAAKPVGSASVITLTSPELAVTIDPTYGADITSIVARGSGRELLFQTPWQAAAERAIRDPGARLFFDSQSDWLQKYRGGWQVLCPVASVGVGDAPPHTLFHGEASRAAWHVDSVNESEVRLVVDLVTEPLRITKSIKIDAASVRVRDEVSNLGRLPVSFDFSHHVAFGADLLSDACVVTSGASRFVRDPASSATPDREHSLPWPPEDPAIASIPAPPGGIFEFGWLADFTSHWARIETTKGDLAVHLEWSENLPHAWLWKELEASAGWPWFGQARVVGIEPANVTTSGPNRAMRTTLDPDESVEFEISLQVESGTSHESNR